MADSGSWNLWRWRGCSPFSLVRSLALVTGWGRRVWSSGRGSDGVVRWFALPRSAAATATPVQQCFPPGAINSFSTLRSNWPSSDRRCWFNSRGSLHATPGPVVGVGCSFENSNDVRCQVSCCIDCDNAANSRCDDSVVLNR